MKARLSCLLGTLLFFGAGLAAAAQTGAFTYQGSLRDSAGPFTGIAEFQVTLWDALNNGAQVASATPATVLVNVTNGLFTMPLDFGGAAFNGQERFLQLEVRTVLGPFTRLTPRQQVTPAPYALRAATAGGLMGIAGAPLEVKVGGLRALRLEDNGDSGDLDLLGDGAPNVIGGAPVNFVPAGVFGATNLNGAAYSNSVLAGFGVIGGGLHNRIDADAVFSTISGGIFNQIGTNAGASIISGGYENKIASHNQFSYNTIAGGRANEIGTNAAWNVISGGNANRISANAVNCAIIGGLQNTIGPGVNGGSILGGLGNTVDGLGGIAAGRGARTIHNDSFVWNSYGNPAASTLDKRFHVFGFNGLSVDYYTQLPAGGGARWIAIGPQVAGQTISTWTGAYLSDLGIWQSASDRNRKTDLRPANVRQVLSNLVALPIRTWRYTNEAANVRHLGPTAQDFKAAFNLGTDHKSIGTLDAEGVALAAIQGLHHKLEEELKRKETEMRALKERLEKLEGLITFPVE